MTTQSQVTGKATTMLKQDPTLDVVIYYYQKSCRMSIMSHLIITQCGKGKQKVATSLCGSWEESFRMLYNYKSEIELRSLGSIMGRWIKEGIIEQMQIMRTVGHREARYPKNGSKERYKLILVVF
jgi:hypothetical protein